MILSARLILLTFLGNLAKSENILSQTEWHTHYT